MSEYVENCRFLSVYFFSAFSLSHAALSKQLCRASVTKTENFYSHISEENKAKAADCIADVLPLKKLDLTQAQKQHFKTAPKVSAGGGLELHQRMALIIVRLGPALAGGAHSRRI